MNLRREQLWKRPNDPKGSDNEEVSSILYTNLYEFPSAVLALACISSSARRMYTV
jgi:hypothetical protein